MVTRFRSRSDGSHYPIYHRTSSYMSYQQHVDPWSKRRAKLSLQQSNKIRSFVAEEKLWKYLEDVLYKDSRFDHLGYVVSTKPTGESWPSIIAKNDKTKDEITIKTGSQVGEMLEYNAKEMRQKGRRNYEEVAGYISDILSSEFMEVIDREHR